MIAAKLSRVGLEVYTTELVEEELDQDETLETDVESDVETDTSDFNLDGRITQIDYLDTVYSDNFEYDYTDISSNATVSLPVDYLNYFFKGRRVALRKAGQTDKMEWEDTAVVVTGFVNEISYTRDKIEVKIKGLDVLLEREEQFDFKQTLRSEIITKIIEASGLKAVVNVEGLDDDITDFTTVSETSEDTSTTGTTGSTGSASIDETVKNAIKGKKSAYDKALAIDGAFKDHVIYEYYWDCQYANDLDAAWEDAWLNCADGANILCAMFIAAGLDAVIVHTDGHYIVKVNVDGETYYTDNAASTGSHTTRPFGEVWRGITDGSEVGTRLEA